jgi:cyclophilin family peptidyl-prolyl cis-trans isomerase
MKKVIASLVATLGLGTMLFSANAGQQVKFETSLGTIILELDGAKAPKTVANILDYVKSGFYDGTIFHRVIPGFMAQGGGFTPDMNEKATKPPIPNEADNGLKNLRGTIAMARTPDPNSASSQFFINLVNNAPLDFRSKDPDGWGYCVFGKVVKGMEVVDAMAKAPTTNKGPYGDVPVTPIIIKKASIVAAAAPAKAPAAAPAKASAAAPAKTPAPASASAK